MGDCVLMAEYVGEVDLAALEEYGGELMLLVGGGAVVVEM